MNSRISVIFIVCTLTLSPTFSQTDAVKAMLADTALTGTSYSICIADASTGDIIFDFDARRNLAPASVTKLLPTATALSVLGPDYRFATEIIMSGQFNKRKGLLEGDVVIRGGGDPALGSPYFSDYYGDVIGKWVAALTEAGVRHVTGRVAAAETIYDYNPVPGSWSWADLGNYYGAGVHDINFNDNTYFIYVTGMDEGSPAIVDSVNLYGKDMKIANYLTSSGNSDRGYVYNAPYSDNAWIAGTVPANRSIILKASMPDPPLTLVKLLDAMMAASGITVDGSPSSDRVKLSAEAPSPLCVTLSPTLGEIIKVTNHESVNLYAELLRKHLGYASGTSGSFSAGSAVIDSFLDSVGCEPDNVMILDGSGLSSNNNISALTIVRLLVYMYNGKDSSAFVSSLPAAGVSGTMKNYFRSEAFRDRVVAKTGSLTGARSFAGFVTTQSGKTMAFTMIANGFAAPWRQVTDRMEKIIEELIVNH